MKRLLAQIGLTYLSVLVVVFYFGRISALIILLLSLLLFILFVVYKKYRETIYMPVMACVALIACIVNIVYTTCVYDKTVEEYGDRSYRATAVLKEEPYEDYGTYIYRFNCTAVGSKECDFNFISYHSELLNIEPYDIVEGDFEFSVTDSKSNISKGYFLTGSLGYSMPDITVTKPDRKPLNYYAIKLRQGIRNVLKTSLNEDAYKLCSALLIGDKYALSDEVRLDFTMAGASHLIVVSGMHFSILASSFFLLAKKWRRYRFWFLVPALIFIILYMSVTGYSPSVMRSGIMLFVCTIAFMIPRDPYGANSLGLSAIIITLIFGPYIAGDVGLILSFASTFAILKFAPRLEAKFCRRILNFKPIPKDISKTTKCMRKLCRKMLNGLISMLCVNICAYSASLPISILLFGAVPTLSIISSFLLYFPIQLLLILAFIIAIIGAIPFLSFLTLILSFACDVLSDITLFLVSFFADLPFSYIYVTYNFVYLWVVFSLVLFLQMYFSRGKNRYKVLSLVITAMFLVGYVSATLMNANVSTLNIYSVDNGTAVLYSSPDTNAVLAFDCNSKNAVKTISKMQKNVQSIDFVSSVFNTTNSANSLKSLTKSFAINDVLLYDTKRTVTLPQTVSNVTQPSNYQKVILSDKATVTYYLVDDVYITYLDYDDGSLLVVPNYIDVAKIPQEYRTADTIVMNKCPENFELLSCDTLVISSDSDTVYHTMKLAYKISNRVLLTSEGDIKLILEV